MSVSTDGRSLCQTVPAFPTNRGEREETDNQKKQIAWVRLFSSCCQFCSELMKKENMAKLELPLESAYFLSKSAQKLYFYVTTFTVTEVLSYFSSPESSHQ